MSNATPKFGVKVELLPSQFRPTLKEFALVFDNVVGKYESLHSSVRAVISYLSVEVDKQVDLTRQANSIVVKVAFDWHLRGEEKDEDKTRFVIAKGDYAKAGERFYEHIKTAIDEQGEILKKQHAQRDLNLIELKTRL